MLQRSGFGSVALVVLGTVELLSLATIIAAAVTAPLVPDDFESDPVAQPERSRHGRPSNAQVASLQRLAQ